jgi:hypothetical protein
MSHKRLEEKGKFGRAFIFDFLSFANPPTFGAGFMTKEVSQGERMGGKSCPSRREKYCEPGNYNRVV